jgi:hypothetical protein
MFFVESEFISLNEPWQSFYHPHSDRQSQLPKGKAVIGRRVQRIFPGERLEAHPTSVQQIPK